MRNFMREDYVFNPPPRPKVIGKNSEVDLISISCIRGFATVDMPLSCCG